MGGAPSATSIVQNGSVKLRQTIAGGLAAVALLGGCAGQPEVRPGQLRRCAIANLNAPLTAGEQPRRMASATILVDLVPGRSLPPPVADAPPPACPQSIAEAVGRQAVQSMARLRSSEIGDPATVERLRGEILSGVRGTIDPIERVIAIQIEGLALR